MTMTPGGCGRRSKPRSPVARPSRSRAGCTARGRGVLGPSPSSSASWPALPGAAQPLRLILDDVHELVDPVALHGPRSSADQAGFLQLVLSSRLDPPLSLPRLRLQGRLRELRAAQLAFTPTQAAQLLEQSGLRLSPRQVEVLHRRTGGWAAGLRLAALGVEESADREAFLAHFSGDDRSVADYLVQEILSGLAGGRAGVPARVQHL